LSQRDYHYRLSLRVAIVVAATAMGAGPTPDRLFAQDMPGGHGMPSPRAMFGKKQDDREISGPSLSATDEPVVDIRIVGNSSVPTPQILNQLHTRVNRPFDPVLVQRDVRELARKGWFVDVQPAYEQAPNGRIVIFKVVERPVIRYVTYLGNDGLRTTKLEKETDLKIGGPVDPYAVQEARRRLVELYHRNGYNNAQVIIFEGDKPTDHGITFIINEGAAQKIWKVEFVGNEFVSTGRLKTQIDSKPPILMLFKGYVDRELIEADVNKLTAYYRKFGYFDAKIGRQLVFDDNNKWLTLRFVIHEGLRYQVESVAFIGNKIFASDSLTMGVELKPDSSSGPGIEKLYRTLNPLPAGPRPFEQDKMNADVAWLKELYGSQGYVFADIKAEPIFLEQPGRLKLMYHIEEGKQWRIGNIYVHINGDNPHTKIQTALNRLSFRSGQIADIREFHASERRLQASGLFLTDPVHGISPKITYHIPELQKTQMAKGDNGFRGQSPDNQQGVGAWGRDIELLPAEGLPVVVQNEQNGPPLIAPPNTFPAQPRQQRVYKVETPAAAAPSDDQLDVHLEIQMADDDAANAAQGETLPPSAQRHEVQRPPYDSVADQSDWVSSAPQTSNSPTYPSAANTYPQNATPPANRSGAYQGLVIRTQSPYPSAATQGYAAAPLSGSTYSPSTTAPTTASPTSAADRYATSSYGGQTVGATGPDAAPVGGSPYSVRQAAITEPQLPPSGSPSPAVVSPQPAPAFGPPPIANSQTEPLPAPAYAPTQPYGPAPSPQSPAPVYGPAPVFGPPGRPLGPDPSITPVSPGLATPYPVDPFTPMTEPAVDLDVVVSEAQTGRLMLGVAVNSDAGLVGQILLDEQNFDILNPATSWQDFIDGRGWRGGGERFRIEAAPGTEVQRYLVSFQEPYIFNSPYSLGLSGSFFNRKYRDWDEQRVGGRVSLGYQWVENDLSTNIAYRGEDVEVSNISVPIPELTEVLGHNAVHGFKWTVAHDTRNSAFLATEGHFLQLELEQVVGSFQYPRAILDARQYVMLNERPDRSGRHVLTLSTRVGFSGTDTPVYDRFFAGGFSSLRGFDFRGASPVKNNVQVGGDFEFINTVEYLFPLTADDMIHGVAFVDFGTVNENAALNNFRVAPGLGLRITVPAMGPAPIALDFAFPVAKADTDDTQVFSFNVGLQR
jgi:outer membrane protein insertion porin family